MVGIDIILFGQSASRLVDQLPSPAALADSFVVANGTNTPWKDVTGRGT